MKSFHCVHKKINLRKKTQNSLNKNLFCVYALYTHSHIVVYRKAIYVKSRFRGNFLYR